MYPLQQWRKIGINRDKKSQGEKIQVKQKGAAIWVILETGSEAPHDLFKVFKVHEEKDNRTGRRNRNIYNYSWRFSTLLTQ